MIHPNMLKRKADADGLSAQVVERDYVLTHVLSGISRCEQSSSFVFKGGTALRLCHLAEYRYSADLDFSLRNGLEPKEARDLVADVLVECRERLSFPLLRLSEATPPRIEYVGPLDAKPRTVKLDLAYDELVEEATTLEVLQRYEDQDECECTVYALGEIAAEKLRCVMQRLQCRDLFDLHELLAVHGVDAATAWPVFERKARHRGLDPGRFAERFEKRVPEWRARWDKELVEYVDSPPPFEAALRAVRRELRFALAADRSSVRVG
jgi:predicted nucleotidyltransferase component of viral defense system